MTYCRIAPQLAAQVGVAISTGGWSAAAFMGSQIAGGQYLDLTEAGVSNDRARAAASLNAVAQSALEKWAWAKSWEQEQEPLKSQLWR